MEVSNKTWNNRDKKGTVIKLGGVGGIGGVVLFGGALITAVFAASAFVNKRRGRSSSAKDHGDRRTSEIEQQNEKERVKEGHQHEQSEKAMEKLESGVDNSRLLISTHSSAQGIPAADVENMEATGENPRSITPKKPENDSISDAPIQAEEGLQLCEKSPCVDVKSSMQEQKIQSIGEDFSKETNDDSKHALVDEQKKNPKVEGDILKMNGKDKKMQSTREENTETTPYCDIEVNIEDTSVDAGLVDNMEPQKDENAQVKIEKMETENFLGDNAKFDSEKKHNEIIEKKDEDEHKAFLPLIQETKQNVHEDHPTPENREIEVEKLDEKTIVLENIRVDKEEQANEELVETRKVNEVDHVGKSKHKAEEDIYNDPHNKVILDDADDTFSKLEEHGHDEGSESGKDYVSYETCNENIDIDKDNHITTEVSKHFEAAGEDSIDYYEDETHSFEKDSKEISSEHDADSSTESNSEAVSPAESLLESSIEPHQVNKLDEREIEGKIQEDKAAKEREPHQTNEEDFKSLQRMTGNGKFATIKEVDHSISSTKRRMLIMTVLMLTSVSGSLFFGLSTVKLCLIAFLTMIISEINAY